MLSIEGLSKYHQERVITAKRHLLSGDVSISQFPAKLRDELTKIWTKPVLFSSLRHAKIEPLSQFIIGSALFQILADEVGNSVDSYNLVWETHPRGPRSINLVLPSLDGVYTSSLGEDLPNFTTWKKVKNVEKNLRGLLNSSNWGSIKSHKPADQMDAIEQLAQIYEDTINCQKESTFTQLCLKLEKVLVKWSIPCLSDKLPEPQPFSLSGMNEKVNLTLRVFDESVGIENIIKGAVDEKTAANVFVGGTGNLIRIGFSTKRNRFQVSEYLPTPPYSRVVDRKSISKEEVFSLLNSGEITCAGVPSFLAIVAASTVVPVAHLGNEYGGLPAVKTGLEDVGLENTNGYLQITEENKDAWPIAFVNLDGDGNRARIDMASMFILGRIRKINFDNLAVQALKQGFAVEMGGL